MQQRRGATIGASVGTTVVHQDSNAMPLTSTFGSLLHRLTRLNTIIRSAMAKREEENSNQEGYKKYVDIYEYPSFYFDNIKGSCGGSLEENAHF